MQPQDEDILLEVGEAGKLLDISTVRLRDLADAGRIPVLRTARGQRLFRLRDVEALARERAQAGEQRR
jgi:excisionase family DNA binding protein